MGLLLAFAPFAAFVIIERVFSVPSGLAAGALIALLMLLRDVIDPARRVPQVPHAAGIVLTVAALVAALKFTSWYRLRHTRLFLRFNVP